jgi:hypothetical protein
MFRWTSRLLNQLASHGHVTRTQARIKGKTTLALSNYGFTLDRFDDTVTSYLLGGQH